MENLTYATTTIAMERHETTLPKVQLLCRDKIIEFAGQNIIIAEYFFSDGHTEQWLDGLNLMQVYAQSSSGNDEAMGQYYNSVLNSLSKEDLIELLKRANREIADTHIRNQQPKPL